MLESDYRLQVNQLLAALDNRIELPPQWSDYFAKRGAMPTAYNEQRRFVRHYCRARAVLEIQQCLPEVRREHTFEAVYLKDISRNGISIVHSSQLFPEERCTLWLPDRKLSAIVVRSKRLNPQCYVVGLRWMTKT